MTALAATLTETLPAEAVGRLTAIFRKGSFHGRRPYKHGRGDMREIGGGGAGGEGFSAQPDAAAAAAARDLGRIWAAAARDLGRNRDWEDKGG